MKELSKGKALFISHVMIGMLSSHLMQSEIIIYGLVRKCVKLTFLLDNIYIRFGSKLYRQIVGIPMGTNYAPLVADLFLFCYERDFMLSLSEDNQSGVIEAFNSTSRYLDDLLNIDNNFFDSMVNRICSSELQLNKAKCQMPRPHFWIYIYLYRMVCEN